LRWQSNTARREAPALNAIKTTYNTARREAPALNAIKTTYKSHGDNGSELFKETGRGLDEGWYYEDDLSQAQQVLHDKEHDDE
jgi:hypothetical protein